MRAKVPARIAENWMMARELRKDAREIRKRFVPLHSVFQGDPESAWSQRDHGYTKCGREVDRAVEALLRAIERRACELERAPGC